MARPTRRTFAQSTTTRVLASFHTDQREGLDLSDPVQSHPLLGRIVGYSYAKQMGGASAQWTLTIKKHAQTPESQLRPAPNGLWRDPEDVWVRVFVEVDGQRIQSTLGLIDSISEETSRTGLGARSETYKITGRDFGKVFETTKLFVNLFHDTSRAIRSQGAITSALIDELVGTPAHFVRVLIETWLGNYGTAETPWKLPASLGGGPFYTPNLDRPGFVRGSRLVLRGGRQTGIQDQTRLRHGEAISPSLMDLSQAQGSLWDSLQEYSNGVMNELFCDLTQPAGASPDDLSVLVPTVTLRERPFPTYDTTNRTVTKTRWESLQTHLLHQGDVMSRQLAKGSASSRFNYWKIDVQGVGSESFGTQEILQNTNEGVEPGFPGNIPIFNTEDIARHGVRPYAATTRFIPYFESSRAETAAGETEREQVAERFNWARLIAKWLKFLHDWYAVAPYEISGTIVTTRMFPEIRIGHRVIEQRAEEGAPIVYYVEGVNHQWQYPGGGQTTLTLTRGEYEDDELLEYVYHQYEQPRARTAQEVCGVGGTIPDSIGLDLDDQTSLELIESLAAGCEFVMPIEGNAGTDQEWGFQKDFTAAGGHASQLAEWEAQLLAQEQGGGEPPPPAPSEVVGENVSLDDEISEVGTAEEAPSPDAPPATDDPVRTLERQEPLPELEGLDDVGTFGTDPLAGFDDL